MDRFNQPPTIRETDAMLEARYFDGYRAIPDGDDEDFIALDLLAVETLRATDEELPQR
jgi:hypothetical protein